MQIVIDIPEEQIKMSLEESKSIHEDEGEKGFVNIMMLYTNGRLDFIDVSRKTDFYSCKYKILPKGHDDLVDAHKAFVLLNEQIDKHDKMMAKYEPYSNNQIPLWLWKGICKESTIIEADKESEVNNGC